VLSRVGKDRSLACVDKGQIDHLSHLRFRGTIDERPVQVQAHISADPQRHHEYAVAIAETPGERIRIAVVGTSHFHSVDPGRAIGIAHEQTHLVAVLLESLGDEASDAPG
jgi:hypothetical protein